MKTMVTFCGVMLAATSAFTLNARAMCGDKAQPQAESGCCCCARMQKQADNRTAEQLLEAAKEAKGDQRLDALAAVLNKLIEERKAAAPGATTAPAEGHHH